MNFIQKYVSSRRAVTFSELLIVIVITTVLSLFFIFSSRYLIIRSKIARVQEEQRVLQRALGNYQMDYSDFPRNEIGLKALNSPTTYLTSIPRDPFATKRSNGAYYYYHQPADGLYYVVISAGPDGDIDFENFLAWHKKTASTTSEDSSASPPSDDIGATPTPDQQLVVQMNYSDFKSFVDFKSYDPTNGITSDGDIISYMKK